MKRWGVINRVIAALGFRRYLEIGVGDGGCFRRIRCEEKLGVDPRPLGEMQNHPLIKVETSDEFFGCYTGAPFDLVFIDGLHLADQVQRDIDNSLRFLSERGVIVCHDMNPTLEAQQAVPRAQTQWTGDGWKSLCALRKDRPDLDIFTLNTDWGCAVISRRLPVLPEFESRDLNWPFFQLHRRELLNLRSPQFLKYWLLTR